MVTMKSNSRPAPPPPHRTADDEMNADPRHIMPGDRVRAYDSSQFVNDVATPYRTLMLPGTVVARYGHKQKDCSNIAYGDWGTVGEVCYWRYPDLVDVRFDHRERVSRGHFTTGVEVIDYCGER